MATYETREVGIEGETDIVVKTGIATVPDGWNITPEQAASYPFLVGRISLDGDHYHVTSYAQQTFQRHEWKQNNAANFRLYDDALAWLVSECNNVLERL